MGNPLGVTEGDDGSTDHIFFLISALAQSPQTQEVLQIRKITII